MGNEDESRPGEARDPPPVLEDVSTPGERVPATEAAAREAGHEGPFERHPVYEIREASDPPVDVPVPGIRCENCGRKGTEPADFEETECRSIDPGALAKSETDSSEGE
ncbi:hypothetical protein [Haloglomus salinum]|jgi:hypothetical protein|uniref:hypothetical protein n=1 Tax=Haloglomus salinum TaxID=2962673 RepID=UPI0020CA1AA3|nr:hypothetical protein [Haloglomus salinum]